MCGLVGMAGDLTFKHRKVMKDLLFFNTLRGADSTGVAGYSKSRNTMNIRKMTMPGYEFVNMPWIDDVLPISPGCWIGHGRYRTVGNVSRLNAHPFEVRDTKDRIIMVGAHNGTLKNKFDIEKELNNERYGTDSEAFINLIAEVGFEEAISKAEGAWALSVWDSDGDTINLIRNKERPLFYALADDGKSIIWSSEAWMIRIACMRHDFDLSKTAKGELCVYEMPTDTLLSWHIPSFAMNGKDEDKVMGLPNRKGGLLGKPEEKSFHYGGGGYWQNGTYIRPQAQQQTTTPAGPSAAKERANSDGPTDWFEDDALWEGADAQQKAAQALKKEGEADAGAKKPYVIGFEGKTVDLPTVAELKKAGCDWCGDAIPPQETSFAWMGEFDLCCRKCLSDSHVIVNHKEGTILNRILSVVGGRA